MVGVNGPMSVGDGCNGIVTAKTQLRPCPSKSLAAARSGLSCHPPRIAQSLRRGHEPSRFSAKSAKAATLRWHALAMPPRGNRRPGRPARANADETRQRIIQAARLVFSERGYDGATFQAIAARADLTRPAINHHFSSKQALYREVIHDTNEFVIGTSIQQAESEASLIARLTAFISAAVKTNSDNPARSAFLIGSILESQRHPDLAGTENDSVRISREFLGRIINDAIVGGEVAADIDAPALVETLLVVACGVGLYAGYARNSERIPALADMLRQLLVAAFWRPNREDDRRGAAGAGPPSEA